MDPAPGFDEYFPHDLQHLIVEEQLGLFNGIFGCLEQGGTASTFHPMHVAGESDRSAARQRRRLKQRNTRLGVDGSTDFARSERATLLVWRDWPRIALRTTSERHAHGMVINANTIVDTMDARERGLVVAALPRIRCRVDDVARRWATIEIGGSMCIRGYRSRLHGTRQAIHATAGASALQASSALW